LPVRFISAFVPSHFSLEVVTMLRTCLPVVLVFLVTACGGGGGGKSTPTVYAVANSYYGTVVSGSDNSGNMGLTTDASGNGNFSVQFPGESPITETFSPPVSSVQGNTLTINGTIASSCNFYLTASTTSTDTLKGNYSLTCPGNGTETATFNLPVGTYSVSSLHRMKK
jgi:hypothetical protein